MKTSWLIVSMVPLLVYGNAPNATDREIAGRWEWVEDAQEPNREDQSLSEFFAENQDMLEEGTNQAVASDQAQTNSEAVGDQVAESQEMEPPTREVAPAPNARTQAPARKTPKAATQQKKTPKSGVTAQKPSELPTSKQQQKPQQKAALKKAPLGQVSASKGKKKMTAKKTPSQAAKSQQKTGSAQKPKKMLADAYSDSDMDDSDDNNMPMSSKKSMKSSQMNSNGQMNSKGQMNNGQMNGQPNTWDGHRIAIGETGIYANGEFLWWQANETGLDFAVTKGFSAFQNPEFNGGAPLDGLAGRIQAAKYPWKPGFRFDLGYKSNHDAWELFGEYTWFHVSDAKKTKHPPFSGVQPSLAPTLPGFVQPSPFSDLVNRASSEIKLSYSTGDVSLARAFDASKNILLRFFAGARGAWINRRWEVEYVCLETGQQSKQNLDWKYSGYGLRMGANTDWYVGWGVNLFALGSATALSGDHRDHVKTRSSYNVFNPLERAPLKDQRNVYNTQFSGGIAWADMWDMFAFKIYAAWEVNAWYNLAEHYRTPIFDSVDSGVNAAKVRTLTTSVFSTQGLTLGLMIDF